LLCEDAIEWGPKVQLAFDRLKTAMTQAPVLALQNFTITLIVETDTFSMAWALYWCN